MKSTRCPRCESEMKEGFLLDRFQNHFSALPTWVEGEPERKWWGGLKTRGRVRLEVLTRRCRRCGYLESYALDPAR
jgi:predicted Zn-ribbon and HTH transcriptional regulator